VEVPIFSLFGDSRNFIVGNLELLRATLHLVGT